MQYLKKICDFLMQKRDFVGKVPLFGCWQKMTIFALIL